MLTRRTKKYGKKIFDFLSWATLNLPKNKEDPITLNPIGILRCAPHVWIVEGPRISFLFEAKSLADHVEMCGAFNPITRKPLCKMDLYRMQRLLKRELLPRQAPQVQELPQFSLASTEELELTLQAIISEALAAINSPELVSVEVFDAYMSIINITGIVLGDTSPETLNRIIMNSRSMVWLNQPTERTPRARQLLFTLRQF